jgi:hypothetical protein
MEEPKKRKIHGTEIMAFCGELRKYHHGVSVNLWKFFGNGKIARFHLTNLFKGGHRQQSQ